MHIYAIVRGPETPVEESVFIKDGFCWAAFLVPAIWMTYRGLWLPLVAYLVAIFGVWALSSGGFVGSGGTICLLTAMHFYIGLEGNDFRRKVYAMKGRQLTDLVLADNTLDAEDIYFTAQTDETPQVSSMTKSPWDTEK